MHEHTASFTGLPFSTTSSSNSNLPSHSSSSPTAVVESSTSPPAPYIDQADADNANDATGTNDEADLDAVKTMVQKVRRILNETIPDNDQAGLYARTIARLEAIHDDWESHVVVPGNTRFRRQNQQWI